MLTLIVAYLCAGLVGALAFTLPLWSQIQAPIGSFALMTIIASAIGLACTVPVAIPVIWHSEKQVEGRLGYFLLAGVATGVLVFLLFANWTGVSGFVTSVLVTTLASSIFWLIAWRMYPPNKIAEERQLND